ncbi:MAG: transporter, partial [Betaproteobacteria bacterium]|nr:transporter [Betaproteobacteria bacterium]
MSVRRFRSVVVVGLLVTAVPAAAQEFPSKPIRFIVPFPPSGAVDVLARTLGPPMSRALGQSVVVENRAGGNTVIAGEIVARAPADGHTLLLMAPSF